MKNFNAGDKVYSNYSQDAEEMTVVSVQGNQVLVEWFDRWMLYETEDLEFIEDDECDNSLVTRLEVIDHSTGAGRVYTNYDVKQGVDVHYQDNGRTLKIFI